MKTLENIRKHYFKLKQIKTHQNKLKKQFKFNIQHAHILHTAAHAPCPSLFFSVLGSAVLSLRWQV